MSDIDEHLNSQSDTRAQNDQSPDGTPQETSADASSGAYSDRISPDLTVLEVSDADPGKLDDESPGELFTPVGGASFPDSQTEKAPDEDAPLPAEEANSTAPSLFCQDQQSFPFEPLGEYLRRHREAAGITIDQLASTTKIKGRIISALEEDRYEDVPHTPIVRGFLKILATEIGLSADDLLSRFHPPALKTEEKAEFIFPEWSAQLTDSRRALRTRIPAAALFLLVLGVGYYFYVEGGKLGPDQGKKPPGVKAVETVLRKARRPVAPKVVNPAGSRVSEARAAVKVNKPKADRNPKTPEVRAEKKNGILPPSSGPEGDGRPTPAVAETIPKSGSPPSPDARAASAGVAVTEKVVDNAEVKVTLKKKTAPSPSQSPLVLNITAKGDTWLRVIVDGKQRDEVFLLEGESRRWSGNKTFVLTIGNATSTVVELNGSSISLPKTESNLVQDFLISKNDLP